MVFLDTTYGEVKIWTTFNNERKAQANRQMPDPPLLRNTNKKRVKRWERKKQKQKVQHLIIQQIKPKLSQAFCQSKETNFVKKRQSLTLTEKQEHLLTQMATRRISSKDWLGASAVGDVA